MSLAQVPRHKSMVEHLTAFARYLRAEKYLVGLDRVPDALQSLSLVGPEDRERFLRVLQITYCSTREEWTQLATHYRAFWQEYQKATNAKVREAWEEAAPSRRTPAPVIYQLSDIKQWLYRHQPTDTVEMPFYSAAESAEEIDFAYLQDGEDPELSYWIRQMARKLAQVRSRTKKRHHRKGKLNLRALVKTRFVKGDELLDLSYLRRQQRRAKLVVVCDVSKSMQLYGHFLNRFMHEVQRTFARCQIFVFNTTLYPLPHRHMSWEDTIHQLKEIPGLWMGGTRIGASLSQLCAQHLPTWFDKQTRVLICSDGWDTGDLDLLSASMYRLQRRCRDVIWLNPVVRNMDDVQIAGMKEALQYTDLMAPVYNLRTLKEFVQRLGAL